MRQEAIELIVALKGHTLPKGAKNAYNRLCKAIEQASSVSSIQSDKTSDAEKQEPVAWMDDSTPAGIFARHKKGAENFGCTIPLYTTPQPQPCPYIRSTREGTHHCALSQRQWVGLTDEEIKPLCDENYIIYGAYAVDFIQSIEAKLKEKNQ